VPHQQRKCKEPGHGVNTGNQAPTRGFFLVNPEKDASSADTPNILSALRSLGWYGHHESFPQKETVFKRLCDCESFLYAGHHSGHQFIDSDVVERGNSLRGFRKSLALSVLMGCSSARHQVRRMRSEVSIANPGWKRSTELPLHSLVFGFTPMHYIIGGSPLVVGTLWDVLGGDIDKLTVSALNSWKSTGNLHDAFQIARSACRLPHLTGCSIVQYGIPCIK